MDNNTEILFEMPVEFLAKSEGDQERRCVKGYGTTGSKDQDGEELIQRGLDFGPLKKSGFINFDHQCLDGIGGARMPIIIGYPTEVEMHDRGLWIEGELLKGDPSASAQLKIANEMWELGQALKKSGANRSLAYSIEGGVLERRGKKIVRSVAKAVALTTKPVNTECSVEVFMKSICCGRCSPHHPEFNPAHRCGNKHLEVPVEALSPALEKAADTATHGALLKENLDRGLSSVLYGDKECCYDPKTGRFKDGLAGALKHMTDHLGHGREESFKVLRRIVSGAPKSADLAALATTAGLIRH